MGNNTTKGNFEVCKDAANQFYNVANWCSDKSLPDYIENTFYPFAVNAALSCELYFKAIMVYRSPDDEFFTGHDLRQLFNNLSKTDSQNISQAFSLQYTAKTIETFLDENKDTFVDWRYALEKKVTVNLSGFIALLSVLNTYVNSLK